MTGKLKNAVDALDAPAPEEEQPEARKTPSPAEKVPKVKKDRDERGEQGLGRRGESAKGRQR